MPPIVLGRRQAMVAPPPVDPAYAAESNTTTLLIISGTCYCAALVTVLLRLYVRSLVIKAVGADDYSIIVAIMFTTVSMGCFIGKGYVGMGKHIEVVSPPDLVKFMHITFFQSQSFVLAICFIKVSVAFLLMRLAALTKYKRFLWGIIAFMIAFTLACEGTLIFNCWPIAGAWDPAVALKGHCYSLKTFGQIGMFNTCINVITDVLFATLPVPLIWALKMNRRAKVSLIMILGMGYFAVAAGLVKGIKQANFLDIKDPTYWEEIQVWGFIQIAVGIIAACFPTLRPIFKFVIDRTLSGSRPSRSNTGVLGGINSRSGRGPRSRDPKDAFEYGGGGYKHKHDGIELTTTKVSDESLDKRYQVNIQSNGSIKSEDAEIISDGGGAGVGGSARSSQDILPKGNSHKGRPGITKTTEVMVSSVAEGEHGRIAARPMVYGGAI
ncbi:phosphatidylserine decarboxylase [Geopyxis carbonaria]|nr:phosphatidylserine decarboxylase [Geopyxis carbonaria]